jgi:hypothetical protein
MANDAQPPAEREGRADWTGLKVAALAAPVFFLFVYLGKAEMGFTVGLVLCMAMIAIKLRWKWRGQTWFWVTIALILAIHVPFLFIVRWPQTNVPRIAFSIPLGITDFLLISGALRLAEKLFNNANSPDK